jgi:hypothetical protein
LRKLFVDAVVWAYSGDCFRTHDSDKKTQFEEIEDMMKTGVEAFVTCQHRLESKG